jgi:hypothetical protein
MERSGGSPEETKMTLPHFRGWSLTLLSDRVTRTTGVVASYRYIVTSPNARPVKVHVYRNGTFGLLRALSTTKWSEPVTYRNLSIAITAGEAVAAGGWHE